MGNIGIGLRRRLNARFGTAHLVAVVAGLATALLLLAWTRTQEDVVAVVVAASEIRAGTTVEAGELSVIDLPASAQVVSVMIPGGSLDGVVGQVAVRSINVDEPLLASDVRPAVDESGRRAMSISLPSSNAVGGELAAGDIVDVLVVSDDLTRFVADQVPVLAVPASSSTGLVTSPGGWWVTLAVEDLEALEIADGVEHGTVYLLRSTGTPDLVVRELPVSDPSGVVADTAGAGG